jgi:uncharacterized glyoxalase superfamily protein PhnB
LVDVVGVEETLVHADGDQVHRAELSWPLGGGVMLGSARPGDGDRWLVRPGTFGAYVVVRDPDALYARVCRAGAEIIDDLHDTDYGSRDFSIRDPEGNRWSFGTYPGEPRKGWTPRATRQHRPRQVRVLPGALGSLSQCGSATPVGMLQWPCRCGAPTVVIPMPGRGEKPL